MNVLNQDTWRQGGPVMGVLFVCTDNARRSLLAEALLRDQGMPGVRAFSAGIRPADHADPFILSALTMAGIGTEGLWPKDWQSFANRTPAVINTVVCLGYDVEADIGRGFPGVQDYFNWPHPHPHERLASHHHGVWRDIHALRPRIDQLCEDLRSMQELSFARGSH